MAEILGEGTGLVARMNSQLENHLPGPETFRPWLAPLPPLLVGCAGHPLPPPPANCRRGTDWGGELGSQHHSVLTNCETSSQREKEVLMGDIQAPHLRVPPRPTSLPVWKALWC